MRRLQVLLILLSMKTKWSLQEAVETCGRSHYLDNLIDKGKLIARNEHRVVGGNESKPHYWPWTAQLIYSEKRVHRCGAAIVDEDKIITAAHCFSRSRNPSRYAVLIGGHELGAGESYEIKNISIHPLFNVIMPSSYDIAVLRLQGKAKFNRTVRAICLPVIEPSPLDDCIVVGWGFQEESGNFSPKLREIRVPIVPTIACNSILHYFGRVDAVSMICAGSRGADACQGDSGGPLMCYNGLAKRWELQGIVSWGHGCGRNNSPGVYTKISAVTGWIKSQMKAFGLNDHDTL